MGGGSILYVLYHSEEFPGPSGQLVMITFYLSTMALIIAGAAFFDSTIDSKILQLQLDELKKITAILESKEW